MFEIHTQVTSKLYTYVITKILFRRFRVLIILFGLIICIGVINNVLMTPDHIDWLSYLIPGTILVMLIGTPYLQSYQSWKGHPTIAQKVKYTISEEGLGMQGESFNGFQSWANFSEIKMLDNAVVLYFTKNQIYIIPNDSFVDLNQCNQVVEFIKNHIPIENRRGGKSSRNKIIYIGLLIWCAIVIGVYFLITLNKN